MSEQRATLGRLEDKFSKSKMEKEAPLITSRSRQARQQEARVQMRKLADKQADNDILCREELGEDFSAQQKVARDEDNASWKEVSGRRKRKHKTEVNDGRDGVTSANLGVGCY